MVKTMRADCCASDTCRLKNTHRKSVQSGRYALSICCAIVYLCAVCIQSKSVASEETAYGIRYYEAPEASEPYGLIRYRGVVQASIYLIDGRYAADTPVTDRPVTQLSGPVKAIVYLTLIPLIILKEVAQGVYTIFSDQEQGLRVTPGRHRIRLGYWTTATKWVTRDFDIEVQAGQQAIIESVVAGRNGRRTRGQQSAGEPSDTLLEFSVRYTPSNADTE